jgi:hypothetical protein
MTTQNVAPEAEAGATPHREVSNNVEMPYQPVTVTLQDSQDERSERLALQDPIVDVEHAQVALREPSSSESDSDEEVFDGAWELYFALSNCNEGQGLSIRDFKAVFDVLSSSKYEHSWIERFRTAEEYQKWGSSKLVTEDLEWRDEVVEHAGATIPFRMCDTGKVRFCQKSKFLKLNVKVT